MLKDTCLPQHALTRRALVRRQGVQAEALVQAGLHPVFFAPWSLYRRVFEAGYSMLQASISDEQFVKHFSERATKSSKDSSEYNLDNPVEKEWSDFSKHIKYWIICTRQPYQTQSLQHLATEMSNYVTSIDDGLYTGYDGVEAMKQSFQQLNTVLDLSKIDVQIWNVFKRSCLNCFEFFVEQEAQNENEVELIFLASLWHETLQKPIEASYYLMAVLQTDSFIEDELLERRQQAYAAFFAEKARTAACIPEFPGAPRVFRRANGKLRAMLRANISDEQFVQFHRQRGARNDDDSESEHGEGESQGGRSGPRRSTSPEPEEAESRGGRPETPTTRPQPEESTSPAVIPGSPGQPNWPGMYDWPLTHSQQPVKIEKWKAWLKDVNHWVDLAQKKDSIGSLRECWNKFNTMTISLLTAYDLGGYSKYQDEIAKLRRQGADFAQGTKELHTAVRHNWIDCLSRVVEQETPNTPVQVSRYATALFLRKCFQDPDTDLCRLYVDNMLYSQSQHGYILRCIPEFRSQAVIVYESLQASRNYQYLREEMEKCKQELEIDLQNPDDESIRNCIERLQTVIKDTEKMLETLQTKRKSGFKSDGAASSTPLHSERARQLKKTPLLYKAWKEASRAEEGHVRETDDDDVRDRALHAAGQAEQPAARHRRVARAAARARDHGAHDHAVLQDH